MKRTIERRGIKLNRETISVLSTNQLTRAQGGFSPSMANHSACSTLDGGCVSGDSTFITCSGGVTRVTCNC
jgi:hypothetical protein